MDKVKKVFDNIKNKKIRFIKPPKEKKDITISSTNVEVNNNSYVDLHMKIARKVDILIDDMNQKEEENLWLKRDYKSLLEEQADGLNLDLEATALIYGEINFPAYGNKPLTPAMQFNYNEQLGLSKK